MNCQVVNHATKDIKFTCNFPITEGNLVGKFKPKVNSVIWKIETANIANISGIAVNDNLTENISTSFTITKSNSGQTASVIVHTRIDTEQTSTVNISDYNVSGQGTHAVLLHNLDSKITVFDLSKVNDTNYLGVNSWTNEPKTVVNLPTITGEWNTGFIEFSQNVLYLFGGNIGANKLEICKYYFSGQKAGQIWNLTDDTQNANTQITIGDIWNSKSWHVGYNIFTGKIYLIDVSYRRYDSSITNMSSWSYITNNPNAFIAYNNPDHNLRKANMNYDKQKFCLDFCFQGDDLLRDSNHAISLVSLGTTYNNANGYTYKANQSIVGLSVFSGSLQIYQTITGTFNTYLAKVLRCASSRNAIICAGNGTYSDYPKRVSILNTANNTVVSELLFTDTDVTTCKDADYCNSIDKWVCLSDGTAATPRGRRTVYFLKPISDGATLLKYKDTLAYDSNYLFVNRLPY